MEAEFKAEGGFTNKDFLGNYRGKEVFIKYSAENEERLLKEFTVCSNIHEVSDFKVPKPLKIVSSSKGTIAIFEKINLLYPSREKWKDFNYCKRTVKKGARILNDIRGLSSSSNISNLNMLGQEVVRIEEVMKNEVPKIKSTINEETANLCCKIIKFLENERGKQEFSHNDFSINNYLFQEELKGVLDWENSGYYDPHRDIAIFESSIIDEYVRFFHGDKAEILREIFRNQIKEDIKRERLELYRFFQNAVIYSCLSRGECSEAWKAIGGEKEIKDYRRKLIGKRKENVRRTLQNLSS